MERDSVTKSQKGNKGYVERGKWESVFSGKHTDNVPQETHAVSVITLKLLETEVAVRDETDDRLLLHPIQRQNRWSEKKATKRKILIGEVRFSVDKNCNPVKKFVFVAINAASDMLRHT